MISSIKTILELLRVILAAYKYISGEIDEYKFNKIVNERKKLHDDFVELDRKKRLEMLRNMK